MSTLVLVKDLALGDIVSLFDDGDYSCATVQKITPEYVELFRPYVVTGNFTYEIFQNGQGSSQVISYIGHEIVKLLKSSLRMVTRVRQSPVQ